MKIQNPRIMFTYIICITFLRDDCSCESLFNAIVVSSWPGAFLSPTASTIKSQLGAFRRKSSGVFRAWLPGEGRESSRELGNGSRKRRNVASTCRYLFWPVVNTGIDACSLRLRLLLECDCARAESSASKLNTVWSRVTRNVGGHEKLDTWLEKWTFCPCSSMLCTVVFIRHWDNTMAAANFFSSLLDRTRAKPKQDTSGCFWWIQGHKWRDEADILPSSVF